MKTFNVYLIKFDTNKAVDILRKDVAQEVASERTMRGTGNLDYYVDYVESGSDLDTKYKRDIS